MVAKTEHLANYWLVTTQKIKKACIATIINHSNKKCRRWTWRRGLIGKWKDIIVNMANNADRQRWSPREQRPRLGSMCTQQLWGCMSPSANGLEQIAGDGRAPLESKTGIDLQINSHQAKIQLASFNCTTSSSLYPCLKSNLAVGFKCFLNWWTQWSLMNEKIIIMMRRTMRIRIRIWIQIKTTIKWKWIFGISPCLSGETICVVTILMCFPLEKKKT